MATTRPSLPEPYSTAYSSLPMVALPGVLPALASVRKRSEVLAIPLQYADDQTLLVGTHDRVFKSSDGGSTWSTKGLPVVDPRALVVSPNYANDQTIFAGTDRGVFRSTNHGNEWSAARTGLTDLDVYSLRYPHLCRRPHSFCRNGQLSLQVHRSGSLLETVALVLLGHQSSGDLALICK